ncbi:ribosomal protein S7 [Trametes polyzona]|nr:ribosomal protein S7 [Trametes polyzona]
MLASIRHSLARASLRRVANVRTLADSAAPDALKQAGANAGEAGLLPTAGSSQTPAVSGSSSIARPTPSTSTTPIHIPPAEDPLLHLFTSLVMKHGKRQEAARAISQMLLHLHAFTQAPPLPLVREAVVAAAPLLRCRQFKRAAKQFVFPTPLTERQRARTAVQWILDASDSKGGRHVGERVAREIIAVLRGDSSALKKKEEVHKLAVLHRGNVLRPPKVPKSNKV